MSVPFVIVIPARLKSTRLPEKPLVDILGQSMIKRTYNQCIKAVASSLVYVATDDKKIYDHCIANEMQVVMTSEDCLTGTDRVAEFANQIDAEYYINVQGDEPLVNPEDILLMVNAIKEFEGEVINGYAPLNSVEDYQSRSVPKLVFREDKRLLFMSRSPIPGNKADRFIEAFRQICIYGFPKRSLELFASRTEKSFFENIEDIEILRFLEMGVEVRMIEMSQDSIAVDHPEDVLKVIKRLTNGN